MSSKLSVGYLTIHGLYTSCICCVLLLYHVQTTSDPQGYEADSQVVVCERGIVLRYDEVLVSNYVKMIYVCKKYTYAALQPLNQCICQ